MTFTLGVDIGTDRSRGVLADPQGEVIAQAERPHKMLVPRPGWAEHRADADWWRGFTAVAQEIVAISGADPRAIKAVSVSGIGPCMLPLDAAGTPLMNAVLYGVDNRAAAEVAELTAGIGEEVLLARCGNPLNAQSVGPKVLWLRRNRPHLFAKTAKIVTSTSYVVFRLTGEHVIDHHTAANFAPFYLAGRRAWSAELAGDVIDLAALPRLAWTTEIAGEVTAQAAAETGLAQGTPVTVGTLDSAAEAVSVGVRAPGDAMLMYGSTVNVVALTPARVGDARLWAAPWLSPDHYAAMGSSATSGTLTQWFRNEFARDLDDATAFAALAAEAEGVAPGAGGLVMLPHLSGERTPLHDPQARGVLFGLNLTHGRGHLYRALLEGVGFGARHIFETYAAAGAPPHRVLAVGEGARNRVWLQSTSDITGLFQTLLRRTRGAPYGGAFLAAQAAGLAGPADIDRWNPADGRIEPDPDAAALYDELYRVYRAIYDRTRDLMAALAEVA